MKGKKMQKKMMKEDYVNLIQDHFAKQGRKMTNLSKANIPTLKEIIEKNEIPFDEEKIIQEKNELIKQKEAEEKAEALAWEVKRKEHREKVERRKKEWDALTEEQKDKVLTFVVLQKQMNYLNRYWKIQKKNDFIIKSTDIMEEKLRNEGNKVERINKNTLSVNGMKVVNDWVTEPFDWNEEYEDAKEHACNLEPVKIMEQIKEEEQHEYYFERKQKVKSPLF